MTNRITDCSETESAKPLASCDDGCPGPYGKHFWSVPNRTNEVECLWCHKRITLEVRA